MVIKTKEQANNALHRLAEIELSLRTKEAESLEIQNEAKKSYAEFAEHLEAESDELIVLLHNFADGNRTELMPDGKKSAVLSNGTIGYRQSPDSIEVSEKTADLLIKFGFDAMVKITKKPVVAAMKQLNDKDLKRFQAKRVPGTENFYAKAIDLRQSDDSPAA